jgi:CRP-like cAMP-binding protein
MDAMRHQHVFNLAKTETFSHLAEETLERLAAGTTEAEFRRGSIVYGRGTPATGIHVVVSGQLKLCIETPQGDEHVVELIKEGDCFGEAAMLTDRLHLMTAAAVSDCRLLHVARGTLISELDNDHELARRIIRNLSDRLYRRTNDLESVLFRKALCRVARFILDQLDEQTVHDAKHVHLPVSKGLIASRLNMTQEHFSRTLRELTSQGKIVVNGGNIEVLDEDGLRDIAT